MKSFKKTVKCEEVNIHRYRTFEEVTATLANLPGVYTPDEFEATSHVFVWQRYGFFGALQAFCCHDDCHMPDLTEEMTYDVGLQARSSVFPPVETSEFQIRA